MLPALTKLNSVVIGSYFKVRPDKRTTKNVQLVFCNIAAKRVEWRYCAMLRYRVMRVHYEDEPLCTLFVTQIQFSQMGKDHV